ncbi:MAG: ABC transporter ATP-binding protein [Oscillospiraceae bacterium]|nr:ABC transporter ATP-binding protein [Oscillospiraceae bacterium]
MLSRFSAYYAPYKKMFATDIFMSTIITVCGLVYPLITRKIINTYVPQRMFREMMISVAIVFVVYLLKEYANHWVTYYGHMMGVDIQNDMQRDIFAHMLTLPYSYFDKNKSGVLTSRVVNDLFNITELAHHGPEHIIQTTGSLIGAFVILLTINWKLGLIVFAFFPFMIIYVMHLRADMNEGYRKSRSAISEINGELQNSLGGIRVTKAFNNSEGELKKLAKRAKEFWNARKLAFSTMARFNAGMELMLDIMYLSVLTAGGIFYFNGWITIGDFTAYFLFISNFLTPIRKLMSFVEMYEDGKTGFERFCEVMDTPSETETEGAEPVDHLEGDIEFKDVTFHYEGSDGRRVLEDLSLTIPNGKKIALVGPSGGGKTTLCHLIPRFYDIDSGSISIGGKDISSITRNSLREHIGIVQQDVFLFTGTIAENIGYSAPDATLEQIREAAKKAKIDEFIEGLPKQYDTYVGERGVMLSGGQKQRIAIARIFLKDPEILILDEATSALDNVTEAELQQSLDELSHGRTTIVVAHRLSTVRDADEIVFLTDEGVKEQGTHAELLEKDGLYAALYQSQFVRSDV